jgi:hypothetical protein
LKNLIKIICVIVLFFISNLAVAQTSITVPEIILNFEPSPTKEDYEVVLKTWTRKTIDVFNKDVWKDISFKDKKNNIEKKFKDLPEIEKDTIIFATSENYAQVLSFLCSAWNDEFKKFENENFRPIPKNAIENEKQQPATKNDILTYQRTLFDIRKNFAFEQEKFVEEFFNKNSDVFQQKEKKQTLEILRAWNERENLYLKNFEGVFLLNN